MTSSPEQCGEEWGEIEQFVAEISELSQTSVSLHAFAGEALERTVELLGAAGGSVWMADDDGGFASLCQVEVDSDLPDAALIASEHHTRLLRSVLDSSRQQSAAIPITTAPGDRPQGTPSGRGGVHETYYWTGSPLRMDRDVIGVLEVVQSNSVSPAARTGTERLLAIVADLAGDFLRRQRLKELQSAVDRWRQYEALCQRAHASLDLRDTAYQFVNDGRWFIGCDRVSLLVPLRGRLTAIATSGVDTLDRRSDLVRSMEELAKAIEPSRQWLRYRGTTDQFPPQLERPLCAFADDSHSQSIDVVPLLVSSDASGDATESLVGMLVLETFDASIAPDAEERIVRIANLCSSALRNAIDYQSLPMLSLARWLRRTIRYGGLQRRKLAIVTVAVVLAILVLRLIPATHYVAAEGEAQPLIRRNIYAPVDGEVVEVRGGHDESVSADQILVVLRSRDLELELERLQGEYQTTEKRLLAIASARVQSGFDNASARIPGQLAAEEQELKQQLASLQTQIALVRKQRDSLEIRSPIGGRILTWDPEDLLSDRPVQRGQLLVSVADLSGPWVLELLVPDRSVGHVISAQRIEDEPLDVSFTLATGSSPTYRGNLKQIAGRTEVLDQQQASTRVLVSVPSEAVELLRPGTTIKAKFDCGRRSLGFVWLHDLFETVRGWILF
ncbi:HlyD family efflux transporter periplasmic adaptor subunit [Stieleria sp. ICT_E10.1]|uniref:efflux RND transporter periplasmic adaptor subunit n=1 Tax=Stieleria sedimenti TaxID=2976331 RepID=UPI0021800672|nr:HlyD family efflux transporter periplasmic adaptor subunit [Stieleria sedimenti]MCS7465293.1 HlyD family efflux transporter periplasmic adaptor subunit [Stieleria sedimenti]